MTIIFVVSVCLSVFAEFFSAVFDPISIKLGHALYVWVWLCPLECRGCATPGGWVTPKKLGGFRGFGAQKTIPSYSFDRIVLIFGYIIERTNAKILSSHFCNFHLEPKLWRHFRFCKSCRRAMWFTPLDSSHDFMRRGGLRFSLSLIVSELWRHQWRHIDVFSRFAKVVVERWGLHSRPWTT